MPSPTFNSNKIFDSQLTSDNSKTITEGVLCVPSYSAITQPIHFEGEVGDYTLFHGYPNMQWVFEGYIAGYTTAIFNTLMAAIQSAIDDGVAGNYQTLVDSFGNYYDNAQVRNCSYLELPRIWCSNFTSNANPNTYGYVARVRVTGIVQGNTHVGATS